ncbi:hypothetical protein A2738_02715 [Candidatus Nomurabacteria bacterium RIFCSPHIGHO2_01_FULL_42_15]|uniref:EfeO-type cupredoxin-like domain-containing protein n=1 Tax=Candidatus Nomurabacteria bacterium RIFCSPHIGHO2_01_FULL_42_15 TaxID=1801742 RepID=A0A1F6VER6_9BACT|nr:MAG: hypothetical protein A2738_02715 [Candidatus Nomurabacteria bacterium RIFCSPHIGHO2_01_FULL_42_15]OGI92783.1 MAG: hypothetical protein A3A99_02780 [Candidatus Nomurabacteria bacterium RIFCSPLOWO2_01_FULL_41_18]
MNKTISFVLILIVVALGGYFLFKSPKVQAPVSPSGITNNENETETTDQTTNDSNIASPVIIYSNTGYAPSTITIKAGTIVTFKNESSLSMWTASASHPTHGVYPTTGGCLGSTFDSCKGILPGESWSFKFDEVGNWKYHDHLKPSFFGTIVVE